MLNVLAGIVAVMGRIMLVAIFLMAAVANKIPKFADVVQLMEKEHIPEARVMLAGAIVFLIVGSISLMLGCMARIGATLLLVFLALATYYFHDFWTMEGAEQQTEIGNFIKNLALMGAMLFIIANGAGRASIDAARARRKVDVTR